MTTGAATGGLSASVAVARAVKVTVPTASVV